MQTGKVLGIGAALSAGLLAAHVASASVSLEVFHPGGGTYSTVSLGSSGSYGGMSWSDVTATILNSGGTASLDLSFTGLTGSGYLGFLASDTAFSETGTGLSLSASDSQTVTAGSGSGDNFGLYGFADANNAAFGVPSVDVSSYPTGSVVSETSGASVVVGNGSPLTVSLASNYSLTTNAVVALSSGSSYNASFTTSVTGAAPAAVSLPGSGPLTIIGGLVMVGGLAIRRRIKV